jgi:hypothetical protein
MAASPYGTPLNRRRMCSPGKPCGNWPTTINDHHDEDRTLTVAKLIALPTSLNAPTTSAIDQVA